MEMPQRIEHSFHPCPLFLKLDPKSEGGTRSSYRCEACEFEMDAESGNKFQTCSSEEEGHHLLHFSHPHPLMLIYAEEEEEEDAVSSSKEEGDAVSNSKEEPAEPCSEEEDAESCSEEEEDAESCSEGEDAVSSSEEEEEEEEDAVPSSKARKDAERRCKGCRKLISGKYYGCRSCRYYLDESCANLPREVRHFFHRCPLFLKFPPKYRGCDACPTDFFPGFGYRCEECDLTMHVECTKFLPIGSDDKGNKILNWSHHHPLELFEEAEGKDSLKCDLCCKGITGQAYGACKQCRFHIHKTCMGLPREIQHHCHPCPIFRKLVSNLRCGICLSEASRGFAYECRKCWFEMDVECAIFSAASADVEQAEHILHFCHQHPLKLFKDPIKRTRRDVILSRMLECFVCAGPSSGSIYGCKECDVFLHKPCLDVLPQILSIEKEPSILIRTSSGFCYRCNRQFEGFLFDNHWGDRSCVPCAIKEALSIQVNPSSVLIQLHMHPCSLILKSFVTFNCNACFTHCHSHAYYCDLCDFYVGLKCAQNSMTSSPGNEEQIQHFCHWHPLQPSRDAAVPTASCRICGVLCSKPSYFCGNCDFHVHKSCLDILPQKIDSHYFRCTLVLLTTLSFECILCQKESDSGLAFRSIETGFKLCTECYLMPKSKLNDNGTFTSIHHWHPLSLIENSKKDAYRCLLCGAHNSGAVSYYYCKLCECHFHRACAELPFEMHHPLHPRHRLALTSSSQLPEARRRCSLCLRVFSSGDTPQAGVYHCKKCSFQLDRKCASTCIPSIKYQGESHLLTVVENMYGDEDCRVCSISCKSKSVFRCVECKLSLHLCCGPLPCDIKHPCHVHPLVLEDFYVEENYTDKFPCHVCEEERDPMLPVYRCAEGCPMICEIRCAIPEVMSKLLGDHGGDVELKTTFPNVKSEVIPRDEIFKREVPVPSTYSGSYMIHLEFESANIFVSEDMRDIIQDWEREMLQNHGEEESESADHENEDDDDDVHRNSSYSLTKEAFTKFSSNFGCTPLTLRSVGIPKFISKHSGDAELGCGYRLPLTLFPIRQEFFGRYHKKDPVYRMDDTTRSFVISIAFAVIHNMRATKVVDVTSKRVRKWLTLMKLVERAGYDVGFIVDKIKRVWEAHFLIKAKAIVDDTSDRLSREHERLSRREEELLRELEATRKQKEEINEQEQQHHKYAGTGMRSLRKEYADALLMKWKPASAAISDCRDQLWDVLVPRS